MLSVISSLIAFSHFGQICYIYWLSDLYLLQTFFFFFFLDNK